MCRRHGRGPNRMHPSVDVRVSFCERVVAMRRLIGLLESGERTSEKTINAKRWSTEPVVREEVKCFLVS